MQVNVRKGSFKAAVGVAMGLLCHVGTIEGVWCQGASPVEVGAAAGDDPDWSVWMQDPARSVEEVRAAYEAHWAGRVKAPGTGYKPIERWLHLTEGRQDEAGRAWGANEAWEMLRSVEATRAAGDRSPGGNWTVCGPTLDAVTSRDDIRGVGRMNCIAFHPTDPNILFAGAPSGGLWRSYDGGATWTSNTDAMPTLGVSAIVFDPVNPARVYIGTGDRDAADSPGLGVWRSDDGGLSWTPAGDALSDRVVGDLLIHPENPAVLLAATSGGVWRSADSGDTWTQVSQNTQNYKDLAWHPTQPDIVYATGQGRFWRSGDGGLTFEYINEGIQASTRMVIAVTPAAPDNVYVCSTGTYEFRALFRSTDGGLTFTEMSDSPNIMAWSASGDQDGGQAWYDLCIAADPVVVDRIYVGGIRMKRSDDGGATWVDIQDSFLHVDHHALAHSPHTDALYLANDGGIYVLANGQQWVDLSNGIVTGQIYKIGQSPHHATRVMTGYQDNGTYFFNGVEWSRSTGGDGFECQFDPASTEWFFSSSQYGNVYRTGPGIQNQTIVREGELGITETGAWSTPWWVDGTVPETMFVGLKNVWRCANVKTAEHGDLVWEKISSNLAGNDLQNLHTLHRHAGAAGVLFASESNRKLFRTLDAHAPEVVWEDLSALLPQASQPVSALASVPGNDSTLFMGFNSRVWRSEDLGETWAEWTDGLPAVRVNTLVCDTAGGGWLYAGTDRGVYVRGLGGDSWLDFSAGLPLTVRVTELELHPGTEAGPGVPGSPARLRAGTYGRGLWESDVFGETTVAFPPIAFLSLPAGGSGIYGAVEVPLRFRRNLVDVEVTGLELGDIWVENGVLADLIPDGAGYRLVVAPGDFGPVRVAVVDGAAQELGVPGGPEGPWSVASDTLLLVYRPAPVPFGPEGPGGVGDPASLVLWLRGDGGTYVDLAAGTLAAPGDAVAGWHDLRATGLAALQSDPSRRPLLAADAVAGRPGIQLDGDNDALLAAGVPTGIGLTAGSVVRGTGLAWDEHGWIASARVPNGFILHPWKDQSSFQAVVHDADGNMAEATPIWIVDASAPQFYGLTYDATEWDQTFHTLVNDTRLPFPSVNLAPRAPEADIEVRYGWDFDDRYGSGWIAEHFIYQRPWQESHRTIVLNYLAARYGLSMGATQVYFRPEFPEDVAGIGQESTWDQHLAARDGSGLLVSAASDLQDGEYLFWGHDGASPAEVTSAYPFLTPRSGRTHAWVQVGEVGAVQMEFPADAVPAGATDWGVIWTHGDDFLPGDAPAFVPLTAQGAGWVAQVDFAGPGGVFTLGSAPVLGVEETLAAGRLTVFPNPTDGMWNLRVGGLDATGASVRICDATGRWVGAFPWTGERTQSGMALAPGWYLVVLEKGAEVLTTPLLVR